jgi:hypothetical protein
MAKDILIAHRLEKLAALVCGKAPRGGPMPIPGTL